MTIRERLRSWLGIAEPAAPVVEKPKPMKVSPIAVNMMGRVSPDDVKTWEVPKPAPGVLPASEEARQAEMAMDEDFAQIGSVYGWAMNSAWAEGLGFMGYPYLAELTQRAEYRKPSEVFAREMTRKWIKLTYTGQVDATEKLKKLDTAMKRLKVRETFQRAIEVDGFFGRAQIYLDTGDSNKEAELRLPLIITKRKVNRKHPLRALRVIEPIWTYPNAYNSTDPLKPNFYKPESWFVLGKLVHRSRLLTLVSREVPDILKPAYAFGGLSLSQMMKPYVDNWLRTRQSVSDLIHAFSIMVLKTNLSNVLAGGSGDDIMLRAQLFNVARDNRGLMMIDKDTEDFANVAAPISGLDSLQAQSQEQQSAVSSIPLVKLLGITPSGLNASTEGELQVFEDDVASAQVRVCGDPLKDIIDLIQLSEFDEVDPHVTFEWLPLRELDAKELAEVEEINMRTDTGYVTGGVLDPVEVRKKLAAAEDSPYASIDVDAAPVVPGEEDEAELDQEKEEANELTPGI